MTAKQAVVQVNISDEIFNDHIKQILFNQSRYLVMYGGAGSGKSEGAGQKILTRMLTERDHRFVLTRKVSKTIRNSQFKLLKDQIRRYGYDNLFDVRETDMTITCPYTNSESISIGMDDEEKVKSLAQPTGIWYEEPTELTRQEFYQMSMRLRGDLPNYKQEILTFNPINESHWLRKEFFPLPIQQALDTKKVAKLKKRIRVIDPMTSVEDWVEVFSTITKSTYKDNKFIDKEYYAILEDLKNKDYNFYRIYALGEWGIIGDLVFEKGFPIESSFPLDYEEEFYGLDFGFNHPSALMWVGKRDGEFFVKELLKMRGLTNPQLIKYVTDNNLIPDRTKTIYCDSAEPSKILEWRNAGFNAVPAIKGNDSVKAGIDMMKSVKIHSHVDNVELHDELQTYKWRTDKNGKALEGKVVRENDDLICATRYAIYTHSRSAHLKIAFL